MALFTPWKLSSQKLGFFLVTFGFIWGVMLLHFTIQQRTQPESSSMLREQILDLSKRYIKALAEENRNVVDGPYAGVMTAYGKCCASGASRLSVACGFASKGPQRLSDLVLSQIECFPCHCLRGSELHTEGHFWEGKAMPSGRVSALTH